MIEWNTLAFNSSVNSTSMACRDYRVRLTENSWRGRYWHTISESMIAGYRSGSFHIMSFLSSPAFFIFTMRSNSWTGPLSRGSELIIELRTDEFSPTLAGSLGSTSSKAIAILLKAGRSMDISFGVHCVNCCHSGTLAVSDMYNRTHLTILYSTKPFGQIREASQNFTEFHQSLRCTLQNLFHSIYSILQDATRH